MIVLDGISKVYESEAGVHVEALRDVSLRITEGEFVCIRGPSGAGKSTLMNIVGCLDRPSSGSYQLAGREVQTLSAAGLAWLRRQVFGFVFQSYNLLNSATARENVELPGRYAGMSASARKKRAEALLAQLKLKDRVGHLPGELAGGEQQRVAIARALMNGGRVILADEPTGALDRENGEQVLQALEELAAAGHTVILISHNPDIAARADRRIELRDGHVVTDSGPSGKAAQELEEWPMVTEKGPGALSRAAAALRDSWSALHTSLAKGARLRTALTISAILIAVCSGAMVLSIAEGIYRETITSVNSLGLDTIRVIPTDWSATVKGDAGTDLGDEQNFVPLTLGDAQAIRDQVANVRAVSPYILLFPVNVRRGDIITKLQVKGFVDLGQKQGRGPFGNRLAAGDYITQQEDDNLERIAVLEAEASKRLFPAELDALGQEILIENIPFHVKGVYLSRQSPQMFVFSNGVHIPFKTVSALLTSRNEIDSIYVYVHDTDRLYETANAIRDLGIRRRGNDTLSFSHMGGVIQEARKNRARLWSLLGTIAGFVLLAGNLSVMNVMLLSVQARRREIGIRMAIGARRRDIHCQFFGEAIVFSLAGVLIGAACALASIAALRQFDVAAELSFLFYALPSACALFVGTLFSIVPARRASQLDPVTALASD